MPVSLEHITEKLDKKYKNSDNIRFLKSQLRKGVVNEKEAIDLLILYNYTIGRKRVIDRETGSFKKVKYINLTLLSMANVESKNADGDLNNPELYKMCTGFNNRSYYCDGLPYSEALDRVLKDKQVIAYLGKKATYELDVCIPKIKKSGSEILIHYLLGKKYIVDAESGKRRKIRKGHIDDLRLLSIANIKSRNKYGRLNNPELNRLYSRLVDRHLSDPTTPAYGQSLDSFFRDKKVKEYLGGKATYIQNVRMRYLSSEEGDIKELIRYALGRKPIIDGATGKKRRIKRKADLKLFSITNINSKDEMGVFYNPEIYRIWMRFSKRHSKYNSIDYGQALDRAFKDKRVKAYLGKVSYQSNVMLNDNKDEAEDLRIIKDYMLGKKPIINKRTQKSRKIIEKEDLSLLCTANVQSKNDQGDPLNPILSSVSYRFNNRHHKNKARLDYPHGLDKGLRDKEVIAYLGKASYSSNIKMRQLYDETKDINILRDYILGKEHIVDGKTKQKKKITTIEDLTLLSIKNIRSKTRNGRFMNHLLAKVSTRFGNRNHRDRARLTYSQAVDKVLKESQVVDYLGANANYFTHVRETIGRPIGS
jgi:hypothetical protein